MQMFQKGLKKRILIIDDEVLLQRMYQEKLQQEGYEVETAGNGAQGLDKLKAFTPDLVLCDIMMPGTSGLEFLESKQQLEPELASIPVVMLTNLDAEKDGNKYRETAEELGAIGYYNKAEEDPNAIINTAALVINAHAAGQEAAA